MQGNNIKIEKCKEIIRAGNKYKNMTDDEFVQYIMNNPYESRGTKNIIQKYPILKEYADVMSEMDIVKKHVFDNLVSDFEEVVAGKIDDNFTEIFTKEKLLESIKSQMDRVEGQLADLKNKLEQLQNDPQFKEAVEYTKKQRAKAARYKDEKLEDQRLRLADLKAQKPSRLSPDSEEYQQYMQSDIVRDQFMRDRINERKQKQQADAKSRRDLQTQQLQQQIDSGQLTPQQQQKAQRKISRIQQYESQQQQQPNPFIQKPKPASSKSKGRSAALQRVTDDKK